MPAAVPIKFIHGTVTDIEGHPVPEVDILFIPAGEEIYTSDQNGQFAIPKSVFHSQHTDFPEGKQEVYPHLLFLHTEKNLAALHPLSFSTPMGIKMYDGLTLKGRVTDEYDNPLSQVGVYLYAQKDENSYPQLKIPYQFVETDSLGEYSFSGLPRGCHYFVRAVADETRGEDKTKIYAFTCLRTIIQNRHGPYFDSGQNRSYVYLDQKQITLPDLKLHTSGLEISGTILDYMGNAAVDFVVKIHGPGQPEFEPARTNAQGRFLIEGLIAGTVRIGAYGDSYDYGSTYCDVPAGSKDIFILVPFRKFVEPSMPKQLEKGGLVEIHIRDRLSTDLLADVSVKIKGEKIANIASLKTDRKGKCFIVLPRGSYEIAEVYRWKGYKTKKPQKYFHVSDGQRYQFDIYMDRKPQIAGIVIDENHIPISGAKIWIEPGRDNMHADDFMVTTTAKGEFRFSWDPCRVVQEAKELKTNPYLMISHERRNLSAIYKLDKESHENLEIFLQPAPTVVGAVMSKNGKTYSGIQLKYRLAGPKWTSMSIQHSKIITNSNGEFCITGLPPLPPHWMYRVSVSNGYSQFTPDFDIKANELIPGHTILKDVIKSH